MASIFGGKNRQWELDGKTSDNNNIFHTTMNWAKLVQKEQSELCHPARQPVSPPQALGDTLVRLG
jgi:hypothetical protein